MSAGFGKRIGGYAVVLAVAASVGAHAQTTQPVMKAVSLCTPGEQTIMTGRMQTSKTSAKGTTLTPNGKFASLCANSSVEPIASMVYRYGKPGSIEMEEAASTARKFFVHYESGGPNVGTNIVWFTKGEYRYEIGAGVGMGRGVSVTVHKGGKQVADLFSDLEEEDHYSNTYDIDFESPKSPVLAPKAPN